ncbi:unnamed protein product, partial [Ectocarpus sp. 13 AM-2016]
MNEGLVQQRIGHGYGYGGDSLTNCFAFIDTPRKIKTRNRGRETEEPMPAIQTLPRQESEEDKREVMGVVRAEGLERIGYWRCYMACIETHRDTENEQQRQYTHGGSALNYELEQ